MSEKTLAQLNREWDRLSGPGAKAKVDAFVLKETGTAISASDFTPGAERRHRAIIRSIRIYRSSW